MQPHGIKHFILRTLLAALPVFIFIGTYAVLDPFKVIHRYDEKATSTDTIELGENGGFISIKALERNMRAGRTYDSFILGSSMSQSYPAEAWKQHLSPEASVMHLDASLETLQGIADKLDYLHRKGIKVKNALIIIEEEMLHREPNNQHHLYMRVPVITSDVNWLQFHLAFFNIYKNPLFIKYSLWPQRYESEMVKMKYATSTPYQHTASTNENIFTHIDSIIAAAPDAYFTPKRLHDNDYQVLPRTSAPISPAQEQRLRTIAALLKQDNTDYIVLLPPRYKRTPMSTYNLAVINEILGEEHVHDFTRDRLASDPRAYYDKPAHIITACSSSLLHRCYTNNK